MKKAIVWFRNDLRIDDNPALFHAAKKSDKLILLYILETNHNLLGEAQKWWLEKSLNSLQVALKKNQHSLVIREGKAEDILSEIVDKENVEAVYWNRRYEPETIEIDKKIKQKLNNSGVSVTSYNGNLLFEPWEVLNKSGTCFKVYTPFWKQCLNQIELEPLYTIPKIQTLNTLSTLEVKELTLLSDEVKWTDGFEKEWQPGEIGAQKKLQSFIKKGLEKYNEGRDFPGIYGTSRLSPHLHFGEISPKQIWVAIDKIEKNGKQWQQSIECYLSELGWREFSYYLLYHFPKIPSENFKKIFDNFKWEENEDHFSAWKKGQTGYPIVDAGMRELWHTGYMHNRVRMITASFLVKDLLIDWRKGAEWFFYTLLDADLANNTAGWQWVAGSGADAAPYFRIFNPVLQGKKFDSDGTYVRKWCPELKKLPNKYLQKPWEASQKELENAGIVLGKNYPKPLVNHKEARDKALAEYKKIK